MAFSLELLALAELPDEAEERMRSRRMTIVETLNRFPAGSAARTTP